MSVRACALAASLLFPIAAMGADDSSSLALAKKQVEAADYRMTGHLVRVDEKGTRSSYGIGIKAHWFPGILRVLLEVATPANARVHVLLEMRPGGESTIQIAHPGDTRPAPLPFEKWSEGPLGAGFSYEDFLEGHYFWPSQAAPVKVKYGARNCDLIVSKPGEADRTHYGEVSSWLDPASGFPVYVEKTLKGSGTVKKFTYFGLHQRQGTWYADQVEAKIGGHPGSMLLIIDRGSPKAHLDLKDFSSAQLAHF